MHTQRDIFYITGPSGSGKTMRLKQIHQALQAEYHPQKITGFLALARYENGQITGYELHCTGGQVFPLASCNQSFSYNFRVGRFNLAASVFRKLHSDAPDCFGTSHLAFDRRNGPLGM